MDSQLEKLDPDKNGLATVPREITSSTLTTRLKGVCKINRLIDHSNDICHTFAASAAAGSQSTDSSSNIAPMATEQAELQLKYQESVDKFRDWIISNKIIEHIFGPNCHVEIIKQSHTILNFVAYSLTDEHVNVIWSASLLKHCGRQVLDLLTSLVRFMRPKPVLRLYWLVKSLQIEDHSEHTLLLTSHILRFIWSHSPCINQVQFCSLQKTRQHHLHQQHHQQQHLALLQQPQQTQQQQQQQRPLTMQQHHHLHRYLKQQEPVVDGSTTTTAASNTNNNDNVFLQCNLDPNAEITMQDREWLRDWKENDFLDNTSDVSACCSDDKNMGDFDEEAHEFIQDENSISQETTNHQQPLHRNQLHHHQPHNHHQTTDDLYNSPIVRHNSPTETFKSSGATVNEADCRSELSNLENRGDIMEAINDSTSTSRDSETKFRISICHNADHFQQQQQQQQLHHQHYQQQQLPLESIMQFEELKKTSFNLSNVTSQISADDDLKSLAEFNLVSLSNPGRTLLWDLLQDSKIEQLPPGLHVEVENVLVNLVMSFGDRYIRYKFIEACLENLSVGTSVIISLRLLPKLMSFNTITRNLSIPAINETHTIVLWAEREYNMSQNFFKDLVDYCQQRKHSMDSKSPNENQVNSSSVTASKVEQTKHPEEQIVEENSKSLLFSHIDKIITRMSFLTFIYSKPFSPDSVKLTKEQMDQLWDCLASDSNLRCSDVLFQWIYQQAVGEDFHGVNDELLDYVLKHKLPTLEPEFFRLRGLKLLEQLLWIRQDFECCHAIEHPATKLLWDIGLRAVDEEVSLAAIRILNHFYIYTNHQKSTKCDKGTNFMNYCMEQLQSCLTNLTHQNDSTNVNHLLDVMQKVILLIRTHLEVFKAHWSFYLRILQLNNEADLVSHRLNAYEIKLTMTIRLVCQAASSMDKTTIEVQGNDFIGELRAEIVKWWYTQVDRSFFERTNLFSFSSSSTSSSTSPTSNQSFTNQDELSNRLDDSSVKYNEEQDDEQGSSNSSDLSYTQKQQETESVNQNKRNKPTHNTPLKTPGVNLEQTAESSSVFLDSFTDFLLANHHSLRLLSHNQEIPFEWDERQINELDFKDMQVIYVLNDIKVTNLDSAQDDIASDKSNESNHQNPHLAKTEIPSILLLKYEYFERLMEADRFLGSFQSKNIELTNKSKTLSRRVWEIIQILPTCPHYKEDLKRCGLSDDDWRLSSQQCSALLSAESPQKLLYSLQIIDILKSSSGNLSWGNVFISKGGLTDIYDVFMSQKLLPDANEDWNEWLQECLAYLLKLLFKFGTKSNNLSINDSSSSSSSSKMSISSGSNRTIITNLNSVKKIKRNRNRAIDVSEERLPIPQFSDELLKLLSNTESTFNKLIWILESSAFCKNQSDQYYYVTISSRAMIVHHVMSFLSSWCKSDSKFPKFQINRNEKLLKALILDDTDASARREACNGFFKLHYATTTKSSNTSIDSINSTINTSYEELNYSSASCNSIKDTPDWSFSADLLKCLIGFLPIAESMKPLKPIRNYVSENDYIKELNSPGCRDYFWLVCRLIDSPATFYFKKSSKLSEKRKAEHSDSSISSNPNDDIPSPVKNPPLINLFELCEYLVVAIRNRQTYETRDFSVEDDTLRGMLHMMVMALRRDPLFKYTNAAFDFIHELYEYLFAPPTQFQRYHPKCKSPATRSVAFDLMIALAERCAKNYFGLLELLLEDQHNSAVKGSYPTDYWPHDDCRSEVGFVGLINLGATCYLATCMQHLFMIPNLRYAILSIEDTKNIRHGEIIRELQKIFTFMLESERKAYNPRNFCKVYTMDNHPLNISEQTDMTEFLTDLMTKLEESSPELRQIIKGLFSGTLSNNVVSLDCPHISRTTEEFYTLRVQVSDMRNLNDSLDELTVKDTLEGDNMYTCSSCERKVRAEKRACIVKLPRILCFNTMRYTFNMATMTKEKVNTHFSFPLKLDMSNYLETNLMKREQSSSSGSYSTYSDTASRTSTLDICNMKHEGQSVAEDRPDQDASVSSTGVSSPASFTSSSSNNLDSGKESETMYELIGVTVHTGNADGGHYYCFIRDCEDQSTDKPRWYLFNDAEVKPFDDSHIGTECYGGELTTKSYDAINDRFMDFSIEKTNSAYMLFYKRVDYKYHSRSVALRYLESDTQRYTSSKSDKESLLMAADALDECQDEVKVNDVIGMNKTLDKCQTRQQINSIDSGISSRSRVFDTNSDEGGHGASLHDDKLKAERKQSCETIENSLDFNELCQRNYNHFKLPKHLASWIWADNMKFARDKNVFEHNYFNFMWQVCANLPRTLNHVPEMAQFVVDNTTQSLERFPAFTFQASEDAIAIRTVHLAIAFVLGVLMNSRERPDLSNWTELIRKQFNSSKAACDWLMHLIDDEETWLKQMLLKCPIEMVRQLFQRLCNDLTGSKQHKKLRLVR